MFAKAAKFIINSQNKNGFGLMIIFAICLLVIFPLGFFGIPRGTDLVQHFQFAWTYYDSITKGDMFPGWAASENLGFGSIGIRFYPPIAYYLLAFTQIIFNDWYLTIISNTFFWMFIGSVGMFFLAKEWLSPIESIFVAIIFAFAPYHRFQIYHFFLFAEFAAISVLPFCFLAITKLIKRGNFSDVIFLAISYGILILTHIPTTIVGTISLGIYALFLIDWNNFRKIFLNLFLALTLSLLANLFHLLRLVFEIDWVKHNLEGYTKGYYDYRNHLLPIDLSVKQALPAMETAIILLILQLIPLIVFFILTFKKNLIDKTKKQLVIALLILQIFCLFMMTFPSSFIWEKVSVLQKIQFPWRWLSVASVISSLSFVLSVSTLLKRYAKTHKPLFYLSLILFTACYFYLFSQTISSTLLISQQEFPLAIQDLGEKKGCECWQPIWAETFAFDKTEKISSNSRNFVINKWENEVREFQIDQGESQDIRIATFYYPHWKATVNDVEIPIKRANDGTILISIGTEKSNVKLAFREPFIFQIALFLSIVTWILLISVSLFLILRKEVVD